MEPFSLTFKGTIVHSGDQLVASFAQPLEQPASMYRVRLVNFAFEKEITGDHVVITSNLRFVGMHGSFGSDFLTIVETTYRSLVWQPPPTRLCLTPGPGQVTLRFDGFDSSAKDLGQVYMELSFEPVPTQ